MYVYFETYCNICAGCRMPWQPGRIYRSRQEHGAQWYSSAVMAQGGGCCKVGAWLGGVARRRAGKYRGPHQRAHGAPPGFRKYGTGAG